MAVNALVTVNSNLENGLTWVNNTTMTGGFHIERTENDGSTWDRVSVVSNAVLSIVDSGVDNVANTYRYRVSALPVATGIAGTQAMESVMPGYDARVFPSGIDGLWFWTNGDTHGSTAVAICDEMQGFWVDRTVQDNGVSGVSTAPLLGSGISPACGTGIYVGGQGANGHLYPIFSGGSTEFATSNSLGLTSGTLFFMLRPENLTAGAHQMIMSQFDTGDTAGSLAISPTGGSAGLNVYDGAAWQNLIPAVNLSTFNFQLITVDFDDDGNATGYVGQTAYNTVASNLDFSTAKMTLGGPQFTDGGNYFQGEMAEVMFFQYPLVDELISMSQSIFATKYNLTSGFSNDFNLDFER